MSAALRTFLRSLLAFAGALVTLALVTTVASWLPPLLGVHANGQVQLGVHANGQVQLGWDLAFSVLGGAAAVGFAAYHAPCWPRLHGLALWLLIAAASVWACVDMGNEFPRWFVLGLLISLPLQLAGGLLLGARRTRHAQTATHV